MAYVDDADVQIHLPVDKLKVEEIPDDKDDAFEDAERIIRGYLAGVVSTATLDLWATPDDTPDIIRAIAGRFAAAKIYRVRYSEDSLDDPQYAQGLYNDAMAMINAIIAGNLIIDGVTDTTQFDNTYFTPNDASTDTPKFTMAGRF